MSEHIFRLDVRVHDPVQLFEAALESALKEGGDESELRDTDGNIDADACLIQLLDPGSLPGCKIYSSESEGLGGDIEESDDEDD